MNNTVTVVSNLGKNFKLWIRVADKKNKKNVFFRVLK